MDAELIKWLVGQAPVVVVMGVIIWAQWKEKIEDKAYSRAQDKLITDTLNQMSNLLSRIGDSEKATAEGMSDIAVAVTEAKTLVDIRTSEIITLLKSK
jgi:hypothetical protein